MKKWVIKRSEWGGTLEVWEYIDSEEEAKKYWYIAHAIKKYGIEKVIPLAMNDNGGYHHLPSDSPEIVRIIESEKPPELSVYMQYPVNAKEICNGWMAPDGTTFSCNSFGHIECAVKLFKEFGVPDAGSRCADESLLKSGWIKIYCGRWCGYSWKNMTDSQALKLESLKIGREGDLNG